MKCCLEALIRHELSWADFRVHYHIGDVFSGETDLVLNGVGHYELWSTATRGRQRREYSGEVDHDRVAEVVDALLASEIWTAGHVREKPGDDDPEASISIECRDKESRISLWVSEIPASRQFQLAQKSLLALVHGLSAGDILERGQ